MKEKDIQILIKKFRVPENIVRHMEKVAVLSLFLGEKLVEKGEKVDLELLNASARLHDLLKLCDFQDISHAFNSSSFKKRDKIFWQKIIKKYHKYGHITAAYKFFNEIGEPEMAEIIKKHDYLSPVAPDKKDRPVTWEEKILYYADKRILHDRLVSLKERLKDGRKRYHGDKISPEDKAVEIKLYRLEKEILKKAGVSQKDISGLFS
jgi:uncharacterized protein